jgi:hypothetical protein
VASLLDRVVLHAANRRALGADLSKAVIGATFDGSMEEKPTLELTCQDPDADLIGSNVLLRPAQRPVGSPEGFTLRPIDLLHDGIMYRLKSAKHEGTGTVLAFQHRGVSFMEGHDWPLSASRSGTTRALFIRRQVDEVGAKRGASARLAFWAPGVGRVMAVAKDPNAVSLAAEPHREVANTLARADLLKGLTIKGAKITHDQRRNVAIALEECDNLNASPKVTLACILGGINESQFKVVKNPTSVYAGVWQADPKNVDPTHTREMCRYFLKGGKGFQAGGAIECARKNPGKSAGWVVLQVEGSLANFGGDVAKGEAFYNAHKGEAEKLIDAGGGAASTTGGGGSYTKSFKFRRDKGENGWESTGRLAEEVNRRRFVTIVGPGQDLFIYSDDDHLTRLPPQARFSPDHPSVTQFDFDMDYGKTARVAHMTVLRDSDDPLPLAWGLPVVITDADAANGAWLVWSVHEVDDAREVEIELRQATKPLQEPASDRVQRSDVNDADTTSEDPDVEKVYSRAFAISERNLPYVWGGGHTHAGRPDRGTGRDPGVGFDCSGYVAACLKAGGMLPKAWEQGVPDSGHFASSWGKPGKGDKLTVWANGGHVFIEFNLKNKRGTYADTSRQAGGDSGPHLRYGHRSTAGFTARHWDGDSASRPAKPRRPDPSLPNLTKYPPGWNGPNPP